VSGPPAEPPFREGGPVPSVYSCAEDELRVLLERAVPHLPAPAQRLEGVRQRLRRRRRRRAAGVSVTAVLAVAAAGLLVPRALGPAGTPPSRAAGGRQGPTAATSAPLASVPRQPGATNPPGTTEATMPGADLWRLPGLAGLRLQVPDGWHVLAPAGEAAAYLSNQALALPKGGCEHQLDNFCTPLVRSLSPGGVLVQVRLSKDPSLAGTLGVRGGTSAAQAQLLGACRAVGGTEQIGGVVAEPGGAPVAAVASACLAHPTADGRALVDTVLATAAFG